MHHSSSIAEDCFEPRFLEQHGNTFLIQKVSTDFGLEGSDYVFLSSVAMFGLFGIFLFLPFYIFLIRTLVICLRFIKNSDQYIDLDNPNEILVNQFDLDIVYDNEQLCTGISGKTVICLHIKQKGTDYH